MISSWLFEDLEAAARRRKSSRLLPLSLRKRDLMAGLETDLSTQANSLARNYALHADSSLTFCHCSLDSAIHWCLPPPSNLDQHNERELESDPGNTRHGCAGHSDVVLVNTLDRRWRGQKQVLDLDSCGGTKQNFCALAAR
ncbi:hypothetical protein MN608_11715 [Microdochium nivale]|nr:hypothetical protein MN608_11715 [Microdochium nivale]